MTELLDLFPETYEDSRARFRSALDLIRSKWPNVALKTHNHDETNDLNTDWISADALTQKEKLLIFTTGEHGIEGYVGSAMLQLFMDRYLNLLNPENTGILLLHAINPWGMKNFRRTNAANVDLNRNFVMNPNDLSPSVNPDYSVVDGFINPVEPASLSGWQTVQFIIQLVKFLQKMGKSKFQRAAQFGQYRFPKGVFYGGEGIQPETQLMFDLYRQTISQYNQVVHLDMHTGYGPRYQMSLVNSPMAEFRSDEYVEMFSYPLVVNTTPGEFYALQGDMIDFIYALVQAEFAGVKLYSTSFEFGTFGNSAFNLIRSLFAEIKENQSYFHGARSISAEANIKRLFRELFYPSEKRWRLKALEDANQAFSGILRSEKYIENS